MCSLFLLLSSSPFLSSPSPRFLSFLACPLATAWASVGISIVFLRTLPGPRGSTLAQARAVDPSSSSIPKPRGRFSCRCFSSSAFPSSPPFLQEVPGGDAPGGKPRKPHFVFCTGREGEDGGEGVEGYTSYFAFFFCKDFEFPLHGSRRFITRETGFEKPAPPSIREQQTDFPLGPRVRVSGGWRGRTYCPPLAFPIHWPPESGGNVRGRCSFLFCTRRGLMFF